MDSYLLRGKYMSACGVYHWRSIHSFIHSFISVNRTVAVLWLHIVQERRLSQIINGEGECSSTATIGGLMAWSKGRQPPDTVLHSSHEPGELSHDDRTINIILVLILFFAVMCKD